MKKLFLSLAAAGMLFTACKSGAGGSSTDSAAQAQADSVERAKVLSQPVDSANAPIIKFEEQSFNFGKVDAGKKVEHEFKFTNTGKSPLVVASATASCGCTVPDWPKKPVLPGETKSIKVTFNSEGKSGLQDKMITVTGNTIPPQTVVHLVGEVVGGAPAQGGPAVAPGQGAVPPVPAPEHK